MLASTDTLHPSQVEPKSPRHGGELVAEVLKAHRVRYLFTLVGGHISPILVASEKLGIRVVDTRHEATAVFAADAVARLSGTCTAWARAGSPGCCYCSTQCTVLDRATAPTGTLELQGNPAPPGLHQLIWDLEPALTHLSLPW